MAAIRVASGVLPSLTRSRVLVAASHSLRQHSLPSLTAHLPQKLPTGAPQRCLAVSGPDAGKPMRGRVLAQAAATELDTRSTPSGSEEPQQQQDDDTWQVKILYDGDCPICMKEVDFLRSRNEAYGTLKFVDISADEYSPEDNAGVSYEEAMGHIHGIMRDGTIVTGVEAFRKFYEVIGLGWVYAITKLKPVEMVADAAYEVWAKYRLPLLGRPNLEAVMEERRRAKKGVQGCKNTEEECEVEY